MGKNLDKFINAGWKALGTLIATPITVGAKVGYEVGKAGVKAGYTVAAPVASATTKAAIKGIPRDIGYAEGLTTTWVKANEKVGIGLVGAFKEKPYEEGAGLLENILSNPIGMEMKRRYKIPIAVGVLGLASLDTGMQVHNLNKMGPMTGIGLSNQVNDSGSPYVGNEEYTSEYAKGGRRRALLDNGLSNYGAEGDIIFALHNMRRG